MLFKRLTCFVHVLAICLSDASTDVYLLDSDLYRGCPYYYNHKDTVWLCLQFVRVYCIIEVDPVTFLNSLTVHTLILYFLQIE